MKRDPEDENSSGGSTSSACNRPGRREEGSQAGSRMCTRGAGQGPGDPAEEGPQGLSRTGMGGGERAGEGKVNRKVPEREQKAAQTGNKNMFKQRV